MPKIPRYSGNKVSKQRIGEKISMHIILLSVTLIPTYHFKFLIKGIIIVVHNLCR